MYSNYVKKVDVKMELLKGAFKVIFFCFLCVIFQPAIHISAEQNMEEKLDNYIEDYLEEYQVPGTAVTLVNNGEIFYSKSWGVTGETEQKVTSATPFTIGSISKSLTGLAVMRLVEEGAFSLEDPVQQYLPWFTLKDQEAAASITIKQLLTQTSGFSTYSGLELSERGANDEQTIKESTASLSNVKLSATPGELYQYSNANFLILGSLIEEVTGQSYAEYMEQEVFLPLGMKDAAADKDIAYDKGYAAGYQSWFGIPRKTVTAYDNSGAPYGYITASAEDMVKFISFLHSPESFNLLTDASLKQYISPFVQTGANRYYGLGIRISNPESAEKMLWHSGSTPDSHSEVFYLPETGWGGVILTNKNHILEEAALLVLKQGIIQIINGQEPVEVPNHKPVVQWIVTGVIFLLFAVWLGLLRKMKSGKVRKRKSWQITGIVMLIASAAVILLLINSTGSPWHIIHAFAPDVALLTIIFVLLLALNGLFSLFVSRKSQAV